MKSIKSQQHFLTKTIPLLSLMLIIQISYAQNESEATKQETVEWIKSKLTNNDFYLRFPGAHRPGMGPIETGEMIFNRERNHSKNNEWSWIVTEAYIQFNSLASTTQDRFTYSIRIDFKNINPENRSEYGLVGLPSRQLGWYSFEHEHRTFGPWETKETKSGVDFNEFSIKFSYGMEENLDKRMVKAIKHLARLNGAVVSKEKF